MEQVYLALTGPVQLPPKPIALTFDDGGLDDYSVAYPILLSHHFVATFFVPTGFAGRRGHASWLQLQLMSRAGMSIESHTVHHRDLTAVPKAQLQSELTESRTTIKQQLGIDSRILAYPGGKYNDRVITAARAAGYVACVTTRPGTDLSLTNAYRWPRLGVGPSETLSAFQKAIGQ
jgi:peptidoglycan/xylan/chitin deacetylase (PgdA/CDA1 family)